MRIALIGVGLIGGSIGLAARERLDASVTGYDSDGGAVEAARERGVIDRAADTLAEAVSDAEAVFVAVPVGMLPDAVRDVLAAAPADCVVSDVGSTKRAIVAALGEGGRALGGRESQFVGGHPLAGAETSGVEHARADLFEGATWYLTPTSSTSGILYERLHRLLRGIGARPAAIDAETHDTLLATVSHLPHVLANVLVAQAAQTLEAGGERLPATGPSFRDATRVAGAPSAIWTDIYVSNRDAIAARIDDTISRLAEVRDALHDADGARIARWNDGAAEDRRRLLEAQLAGGPLFELRASVPNRPGVVAELALELARAGVNITDMALYPARDMSEGVVAMWIAGEAEAGRAEELVGKLGFPVARA
ncbi:MAG TPA: prephenate dehydrogenase/arogenate dehydrogenase family protein [Solirubrobacteraceae bacterium]|nr:prephenate dehydrogenase/arogenate dehydrogenase family protein [Solirubrobacteraceae bacterium]